MASHPAITRLVLGAAALGQPYGIANPQAAITVSETDAVLGAAWSRGIRFIDTAPLYGEAEKRIGKWTNKTGNRFRVISKLPPMSAVPDGKIEMTVRRQLDATCRNLGLEHLEAYLLHDPTDFRRQQIRDVLRKLEKEGRFWAFRPLSIWAGGSYFGNYGRQNRGASNSSEPIR